MSSLPIDRDRRLVPRWRPSRLLIRQEEAKPLVENSARVLVAGEETATAHAAWLAQPSLELAAEVVINSVTSGNEPLAFGPADQLIRDQAKVAPSLVQLAQRVRFGGAAAAGSLAVAPRRVSRIREAIGRLRTRLHEYSRDPFAWLDLSLLYTRIGEDEAARRAARTSLGLAPENRIVVRSMTRLLLHFEAAEDALKLVRSSPLSPHDPWLAGLEIELSDLLEKTPRFTKRANELLRTFEGRPEVLTELAASLGTTSALHGSTKLARTHFRRALLRPNENVVAQARWIAQHVPGVVEFDGNLLAEGARFEARAQDFYQAGNWDAAVTEIEGWLADESFSSRPAVLGSFVAGSMLRDYARAAEIAELGLVANPHNATLQNNLAYALARGETPKKAQKIVAAFPTGVTGRDKIYMTATRGLLAMKLGNEEEGRRLYESAIEIADTSNLVEHGSLARLHFAITELESLSPRFDRVGSLISEAGKLAKNARLDKVVVKGLIARIADLLMEPNLPFDEATRVQLSNLTKGT